MNDLSEITHGWEMIDDWLTQQPEDEAVQLIRDSMPEERRAAGVFVLSATEVADDAHQWRAYAEEARGFAIGIDCAAEILPTGLVPADDDPILIDTTSVEQWRKVMYSEVEVHNALNHLLISIRERGLNPQDATSERGEVARSLVRSRIASLLTTMAHLVKHPGFSGEREVRLVATNLAADQMHHLGPADGFNAYTELASAVGASTRRRGSAPRPPQAQLPIVSVTIGRKLAPVTDAEFREVLVARLRDYLAQHDLEEVEAAASNVPLR